MRSVIVEGNPETGNGDTGQHRDSCHDVKVAKLVGYVARNDATRNRSGTSEGQHENDNDF